MASEFDKGVMIELWGEECTQALVDLINGDLTRHEFVAIIEKNKDSLTKPFLKSFKGSLFVSKWQWDESTGENSF